MIIWLISNFPNFIIKQAIFFNFFFGLYGKIHNFENFKIIFSLTNKKT